jgi:hypothetical protein
MSSGFSSIAETDGKLEEILNSSEELDEEEIDLDRENVLQQLYHASVILKDKFSWTKNIEIANKTEELKEFKQAWENNEEYSPSFRFSGFNYQEQKALDLLDELNSECRKIDKKTLRKYNVKELSVEDLRNLYRGIFEELKLYVKVAANIDDREVWKRNCLKIWPMDEESVMKSKHALEGMDFSDSDSSEENLQAEDLKMMWENELSRIGVDYDIEIRDVEGCFNIPEEQTVVVAKGSPEERFYSRTEAEILTMHELFHVIRSYNGMKLGRESGFPPILGVHTPFYDATEEGGAIYREFETEVITDEKKKDYHLRALAAYYTYQDHRFHDIIEKLVHHGAKPSRAFALAARNREVLRHHIYMGGYYQDWENNEDKQSLIAAKVNKEWADKIQKEIEAEDSALEEPPIKMKDIFEYSFK